MTDSLKLAEMQRTSIEFERQRHLANWFIKSSPHMATPTSSMNGSGAPPTNGAVNSSSSTTQQQQQQQITTSSGNGTKNGTITTTNPLFFIMPNSNGNHHHPSHHQAVAVTAATVVGNGGAVIGGGTPSGKQTGGGGSGGGGNVGASSHHSHHHPGMGGNLVVSSRSQIFTSQTNLPLQILTASSAQEGRKPKLRRFNSHDTSANMFSVADFENARLARRNEIELKQRMQQQRMKMNSLSSGGDCSTGDSKGSKYSNDSQTDPLPAEVFLDRYSLPRVVRISYKMKFSHETLQSSSSNGSSTSTQSSTASSSASVGQSNNNHNHQHANGNNNNNNKSNSDFLKENGELFLLYRLIQQRHIYHGHNAKTGVAHRKKGVMIPQEFPGYFSLINDKGVPTATLYTTLIQLVRERVYKFVSVDNLPAFTESQSSEGYTARPQYIKTTARGGQVFRLLAVFEDGKQQDSSASSNKISSGSGREKEKGRYAQLLNENRQVLYVSLSTKGKFYEIEPGVPQILQKINSSSEAAQSKKVNPDCVHRITTLIAPNKELPMTIRYISGPTGTATGSIPENLTISRITMENVVIACPIESVEAQNPLHLRKLHITPEMILVKYLLGFENEQRMLANQNVQNILKFCQFNCDQFLKMVEVEILHRPERSGSKSRVDGLKILKPLNFPKLLRREKTSIAHEKEDSIIFLSKNDLANMEAKDDQQKQSSSSSSGHNRISEKMKVFQSTKKKWFRRNDKHTSLTSLDLDVQAKRMSMERYNDMSKMLQERFGANLETESISERSTSEIGITDPGDSKKKPPLVKSLSLQEVDLVGKPDLLPKNFTESTDTMNDHHEQEHDDDGGDGDLENKPPQSFITKKLYTEFYVKTRQYSKSSSSLHQLLHFSVPQKMNVIETKKNQLKEPKTPTSKKLEFNIGEEVTTTGGFNTTSPSAILDDLPYSSVRDSLLLSSDESSNELCSPNPANMALNLIDHTKENIYAEICHGDTVTITNANNGFRIESFSTTNNQTTSTSIGVSDYGSVAGPSAVSRVQINCSNSPVLGSRPNINKINANNRSSTTPSEEDNIYNTLK